MSRRIPIIILFLIVAALLGFYFWTGNQGEVESTSAQRSEKSALLSGVVIDHAGRPLRNATVLAGEMATSTDESGKFRFERLPEEAFRLDAQASGFTRHDPGLLRLDPAEAPFEDLRLILVRDALISGQIVANGRPVEGAELSLSYAFAESLNGETLEPFIAAALVATDHRGRFELPRLASGRLHLLVETSEYPFYEGEEIYLRPGQQLTSLRYDIATAEEEVPQDIEESGDVFGRVIYSNGEAVAAARINVSTPDGQLVRSLRADQNGQFRWPDAPALPMAIQAFGNGYEPSDRFDVTPGEEMILQLRGSSSIQGMVVDQLRRPVQDFRISFAFAEPHLDRELSINQLPTQHVQRPTGRFDLQPVPSGRYRLVVEAPGYAVKTTEPITVLPQRITGPFQIMLQDAATLEGMVFDLESGEPIAGAQIQHQARRTDGRYQRVNSDEEGRFVFEGLPAGRQGFMVSHPEYIAHHFASILIPEGGVASYEFSLEPIGEGPQGMSFEGIGATLGRTDQGVEVMGLMDGSASVRAGLQQGDRITGVDGQSVDSLTLDQVIERIRGEEGVPVTLEIQRPQQGSRRIEVNRERVFIPQAERQGRR